MSKTLMKPSFAPLRVPPHHHPTGGCGCEPGVAYVRVSKVGTREKIISPDLQMDAIVTKAKASGVRIVAVVTDIDKSGRTFTKRSVDKIIAEIGKGSYTRVLLWKWSRWARNLTESTKYLAKVRDVGGRVDSATEDADQETAIGRLQFDLVMRFDQYQSEAIGEGWNAVHHRRRDAGLPHGGRARFGYDYKEVVVKVQGEDDVEVMRYVPNADQAQALVRAYEAHAGRKSFESIAADLNKQGFRTTLGGSWTAQGVARMMDTGFAAGLIRERSNPSERPANHIRAYDVWRDGSHEPLITEAAWLAYKGRRMATVEMPQRSAVARHELSALLFCSECGRRLQTKYTGAARTHQWQCLWQKSFHPGVAVSASNRLLVAHVRGWIREKAGVGEQVDEMAAAEVESLTPSDDLLADLERDAAKWRKRLSRLADLYADDEIDKEIYRERKAEYEAELQKVIAERGELDLPVQEVAPDYLPFSTLDEEWGHLEPAEIRDALMVLVGAIVVSPRSAASTNASVADRVEVIGLWEAERLSRMQRRA